MPTDTPDDFVFVIFRCTTVSGKTKEITVRKRKFTIGRAEDCGFRMLLPDVSRQHCLIELSEFGVAFTDLRQRRDDNPGTPEGLLRNDDYETKGMLDVGDHLFIGSTRLTLVDYSGYVRLAEEPPATDLPAAEAHGPSCLADSAIMPAHRHPGSSGTCVALALKPLPSTDLAVPRDMRVQFAMYGKTQSRGMSPTAWKVTWSLAGAITLLTLVYFVYDILKR